MAFVQVRPASRRIEELRSAGKKFSFLPVFLDGALVDRDGGHRHGQRVLAEDPAEGRTLCLFLAIYAFAVFSYVTGTIATYFIGRDAEEGKPDAAQQEQLARLTAEVAALREEVRKRDGANPSQ